MVDMKTDHPFFENSRSLMEVLRNIQNITKITSRYLDHQMTSNTTRTSRRRVTVATLLLEPARPYRWRSGNFHAHAIKDQCPGAAIVVVEHLNWPKVYDTITRRRTWSTRDAKLTVPRGRQESTPELYRFRPDGQIRGGWELERPTRRRSIAIRPNVRGIKNPNLNSQSTGTGILLPATSCQNDGQRGSESTDSLVVFGEEL